MDANDSLDRPDPDTSRPKKKSSGFKWKEKRAETDDGRAKASEGGLKRGYRDRSPRRERHYGERDEREGERDRERDRDRGRVERRERKRSRERSPKRTRESDDRNHSDANNDTDALPRERGNELLNSAAEKFGLPSKAKADKKDKKKSKPAAPSGPMIVVNVNDRLGTKAAIPCLASDSVKAFKAIVAAHIGRQPHEIMLKRQGERPFKDVLTLADYGVSSGVQLDLEIDTGD